MINTGRVSAILVTKEDFNNAIQKNMEAQLHSPQFEGHTEAAMVYAMGGMVFAREVMNILFEEVQNNE